MSVAHVPTATDALRRWLFHAGFSVHRRDAALAALDAFDAALRGDVPETSTPACRWSEARQRWESASQEACGHAHVAGLLVEEIEGR